MLSILSNSPVIVYNGRVVTNNIEYMKKEGLHVMLDIYEYDASVLKKYTAKELVDKVSAIITRSGLTVLSSAFHEFSRESYSITILLSESHVCIHTWPEKSYISCDVFASGISGNIAEKTNNTVDGIKRLFGAKSFETKRHYRSYRPK